MILIAYFTRPDIERALDGLNNVPSLLRPTRYSSQEDEKKAEGILSEEEKFRMFVSANDHGFFLFSDTARYDVTYRLPTGYCTIAVDPNEDRLTESDVTAILRTFVHAGSAFAFAASDEEYYHRNRYSRMFGTTQFDAWIGRDLRKYLPGLYWITVLSGHQMNALQNPVCDIVTQTAINSNHWLIKAFDQPEYWKRHATHLDQWLANEPTCFSKQRIQQRLDAAPDILSLTALVAEWQ